MPISAQPIGRPALVSTTQPCSPKDALAFFADAAAAEHRALWLRPEAHQAIVGVGASLVLEASGVDRFGSISNAWRSVLQDAEIHGPGPRLIGGFSFDPLRPRTALWRAFPDARFVLPQRMLTIRDGAAWLTTNTIVGPPRDRHHRAAELVSEEPPMPPRAWKALVADVAQAIRAQRLGVDKLVLARAQSVELTRCDVTAIAHNLASAYPTCTVFAFDHAGATFLGATPERLVALHGGTASTMALASSVARGATLEEDQRLAERLLHNPKERAEHAYVVNDIRDRLAADGVCTSVIADAGARVRKLANVQHLFTPIRGQVAPGCTVLDLVERLHPSPAVGGYPRARALELLRDCEGLDRGWYAGALGWLDSQGDGEFVVGIRSALLRGTTATLFTGCGIVADSDAASELAESEWKLQPMLSALNAAQA